MQKAFVSLVRLVEKATGGSAVQTRPPFVRPERETRQVSIGNHIQVDEQWNTESIETHLEKYNGASGLWSRVSVWIVSDPPPGYQPPTETISPTSAGVASEIDAVLKSGNYSSLPPSQPIGVAGFGQPSLSIQNQTAYELTVLMAGAVEKSLVIPAGGSQNVVVPAGTYRILGRVKAGNVLPFFGTQDYASGGSYRESFYIK